MSNMFHRHCHIQPRQAVYGDGPYIIDRAGNRYLDGCGGAAVSSLGHNHPRVLQAIRDQLDAIAYAHSGFFTTDAAEELASKLASHAPGKLNRVYFTSGGSESVEAALKLARQYFVECGQPQKKLFIARRQSYHGNTLGALGVGGNQWRKAPFRDLMVEPQLIAPCYSYREQRADESLWDYGQRAANELQSAIDSLGAGNVLAFIAEPVVGATAGAVPSVPGYFKRIADICKANNILLILDEVMCGMGRTGTLFACEQDGVEPDMIAIAKGLGAGYQPIGALMVHDRIYAAIASGSGYFQHGHTYMAHPTACAAALAVQQVLEEDDMLSRVGFLGRYLMSSLTERFNDHPLVGDIRGRGLFIGLELVQDRATKAPLPVESAVHQRIKQFAMEAGLMCYPMAGTIDGQRGHHVLLAPPFIVETSHLDELTDKLSVALDRALAELAPTSLAVAV